MPIKVVVDRSRCQGHARCYMTCPDVFEIDDQGQSHVKVEVVPDSLEDRASRAVEACPESAISAYEA
jgi:ferredoxin